MAKRFSRLKYAYKAIQANGVVPETGGTQPAAGSPLKGYLDYRSGAKQITYGSRGTSSPGGFELVGVNPFAISQATTSIFAVNFSSRASGQGDIATLITAANHSAADAIAVTNTGRYRPAVAIASVKDAESAAGEGTSKITGLKYAKDGSVTYTIPYGADATSTRESEVRADILDAAADSTKDIRVSFKSERF